MYLKSVSINKVASLSFLVYSVSKVSLLFPTSSFIVLEGHGEVESSTKHPNNYTKLKDQNAI